MESNFNVGGKNFNILSHALSFCVKKDLFEDFDRLLIKAEKRNHIIQVAGSCIETDNANLLQKVLSKKLMTIQDKNFVFKRAINENKVECLKLLLEQPSLGISATTDYLSFPIMKHFNEVVRLVVNDSRVNVSASDKIAFKTAKSSDNNEALEILYTSSQLRSGAGCCLTSLPNQKFVNKAKKIVAFQSIAPGTPRTPRAAASAAEIVIPVPLPSLPDIAQDTGNLNIDVYLPFSEKFELKVRSQFRTRDLYKYLEERVNVKFEVYDAKFDLIPADDRVLKNINFLRAEPLIHVLAVFEVKSHEPFGEMVKVHYPNLPGESTKGYKLADVIVDSETITPEQLDRLVTAFDPKGAKKEFIMRRKVPLPFGSQIAKEELSDRDVHEIIDDFFDSRDHEEQTDAAGICKSSQGLTAMFSLEEFNIDFLELITSKAIEHNDIAVLRSCGAHALWRGTAVLNFVLEAVETASTKTLATILKLPEVNPAIDESIAAIAAHALKKPEHLNLLVKDSRVKIHEDGPLVHATRHGMTEYASMLIV